MRAVCGAGEIPGQGGGLEPGESPGARGMSGTGGSLERGDSFGSESFAGLENGLAASEASQIDPGTRKRSEIAYALRVRTTCLFNPALLALTRTSRFIIHLCFVMPYRVKTKNHLPDGCCW